jgi:hypothetical protein
MARMIRAQPPVSPTPPHRRACALRAALHRRLSAADMASVLPATGEGKPTAAVHVCEAGLDPRRHADVRPRR